MAITDDLKKEESTGTQKGGMSAGLVIAVVVFFGLVIVAAVFMLLKQGIPTLLNQQTISPPALPSFDSGTLLILLLTMVLLVFVGIFTLLFLLILCVCGCGCGKRLLEILKKLGLLLPDLPKGLRAAALGFDVAAQAAHISVESLRAVGETVTTIAGITDQIHFPLITLRTTKLWDALCDLHIPGFPHDPPPHWCDPDVITFKQDFNRYPFSGSESLNPQLGNIVINVNSAQVHSEYLETKLKSARDGLNAVAHVFDGQ